jgi:hypothetical protein
MPWDKGAAERESARLRGQDDGNSKRRARLSFSSKGSLGGQLSKSTCHRPSEVAHGLQYPPRRRPDLADDGGAGRNFYLELSFPHVLCKRALALVLPHHLSPGST